MCVSSSASSERAARTARAAARDAASHGRVRRRRRRRRTPLARHATRRAVARVPSSRERTAHGLASRLQSAPHRRDPGARDPALESAISRSNTAHSPSDRPPTAHACPPRLPAKALVYAHAKFSSYEPELFPGLIYRLVQPRTVLLIFVSGKVVITGAKSLGDLQVSVSAGVHARVGFSLAPVQGGGVHISAYT